MNTKTYLRETHSGLLVPTRKDARTTLDLLLPKAQVQQFFALMEEHDTDYSAFSLPTALCPMFSEEQIRILPTETHVHVMDIPGTGVYMDLSTLAPFDKKSLLADLRGLTRIQIREALDQVEIVTEIPVRRKVDITKVIEAYREALFVHFPFSFSKKSLYAALQKEPGKYQRVPIDRHPETGLSVCLDIRTTGAIRNIKEKTHVVTHESSIEVVLSFFKIVMGDLLNKNGTPALCQEPFLTTPDIQNVFEVQREVQEDIERLLS